MPYIYDNIVNDGCEKPIISVPVKKGVNISIYNYMVREVMKKFITVIAEYDHDFMDRVRKRIKNKAQLIGIDPNKYCFDIATVSKLQQKDIMYMQEHAKESSQKINYKYGKYHELTIEYQAMTDEEIIQSQKKLESVPMIKTKQKTTKL